MLCAIVEHKSMKKNRTTKTTRAALFAGAAALMSLAPVTYAQSSDALINKLEQKGVLSSEEAKELREESRQEFNSGFTNSFDKAFGKITGMPDWVTGYKLSGDFRGRFDDITVDSPLLSDRLRLRYRLRVGLVVDMKDDLQVGFRLGSGDTASGFSASTGNPLSNNTTFQDNGSKKFIYVDAAYGKWTAINDGTWKVTGTFGKMDNPFRISNMVFDYDLTPEGAAIQTVYKINDSHSLAFNTAAFVLDEESGSSHDPILYGGQVIWDATWTPKWSTSLGVSAFDIVNKEALTTGNVPYVNQGNTRVFDGNAIGGSSYDLVYNYNPIIGSASITYTLDSFPLYKGKFPIKLATEFMDNPGAPNNNEGYWGGITFGKSGKKGTWDISYRYQYLEADAWYDQLVDDDNMAGYTNLTPPPGGKAGVFGGTNVKGHLVKFNYSFTDSFVFTVTCYVNDLINQSPGGIGEPQSGTLHAMADIMWKF